jgi:predicted metal-dependent hydrolase
LQFLTLFLKFFRMDDLLHKGIEEFNTQFFFEAHDTWEELWREATGPDRLFLQGLIQTAVALYHARNGNLRGARSLFAKALAKLEQYLPCHCGIDTVDLARRIRVLQLAVEAGPGQVLEESGSIRITRRRCS